MIVATAGHIDHGKTSLVKALTGVDTDRLPEEKRRGISIDLGFAYRRTQASRLLGFVDVPGHENFVRTMVAGASGVDFALLVVAADDGIMPQTREHLRILNILGIRAGAVAITKIDRVDPGRIDTVASEVRSLVGGTILGDAEIFPVSSSTGAGVNALKGKLECESESYLSLQSDGRRFRFAIDRAFVVAGSGLVVTGYVVSGAARVGDRLRHFPSGEEARVRRIRVHETFLEEVTGGERCALNISGVSTNEVRRGHILLPPALGRPTQRLAVHLSEFSESVAARGKPIHLHIGTASVTGRVSILRGASLGSTPGMLAKVDLDSPLIAFHGDRIVLRDASARRTLGGGVIINPQRPLRISRNYLAMTPALCQSTPAAVLRSLAELGVIDLAHFETIFDLAPSGFEALYQSLDITRFGEGGKFGLVGTLYADIQSAVLARVASGPLPLDIEATRRAVAPESSPGAFAAWLADLARRKQLALSDSRILAFARPETRDPDGLSWARIKRLLESGKFKPFSVRELSTKLDMDAETVRGLLEARARRGDAFKVSDAYFFPHATMRRLIHTARGLTAADATGTFTVAAFRDAIGTGRTLASDILEALDALGVTRRDGNRRAARSDSHAWTQAPLASPTFGGAALRGEDRAGD